MDNYMDDMIKNRIEDLNTERMNRSRAHMPAADPMTAAQQQRKEDRFREFIRDNKEDRAQKVKAFRESVFPDPAPESEIDRKIRNNLDWRKERLRAYNRNFWNVNRPAADPAPAPARKLSDIDIALQNARAAQERWEAEAPARDAAMEAATAALKRADETEK